jgi:predicted transcriptional regulator
MEVFDGNAMFFESESVFCLIYENEPVGSTQLVALCKEKLGWTKATTYTVIRRLAERGVLKNENAVVSSLVSKDEVQAAEISELVEKTFDGSLPAFIAAVTKHNSLSRKKPRGSGKDRRAQGGMSMEAYF